MKTRMIALLISVLAALPVAVSGQGFGVAVRAGTLGVGAEAAAGLTDRLVLRGGVGLVPIEVSATISDVDATLKFPKTWFNVGLDLYVTGAIRIGGGMLFKPDDVTLTGDVTSPVDIGGRTFSPTELGTLTGTMDSGKRAPYVLIGFGKHVARGVGLSFDIGAAFLKDPVIGLKATGGTFPDPVELKSRLDQEARDFQDDLPTFLNIWPILNLGLRIGVG